MNQEHCCDINWKSTDIKIKLIFYELKINNIFYGAKIHNSEYHIRNHNGIGLKTNTNPVNPLK